MSLPFLRYLLWAMRLELWVGLIAMTLAVLLKAELSAPIKMAQARVSSEPLVGLMMLVGTYIGLRVFSDPAGVGVWLTSRGLTPRVRCQTRLLAGAMVLSVMVLWPAVLMVTGIRQAVQVTVFASPWFPMVRWHELTVIPQMALYGFVPFGVVTLMLMSSRTEDDLNPAAWTFVSGISGLLISACCLPFAMHSVPIMMLLGVTLPGVSLALAVAMSVISEQHVS